MLFLAMSAYRRSSEENYTYSNEPTPMAAYCESPANAELSYHTTSSYNILQPFSSYSSPLPPYYGPHTPIGFQGAEVHPGLNGLSSSRHEPSHSPAYRHRYLNTDRLISMADMAESGLESQESINEATMLSEPVKPPLDGFPNVDEFDRLMKSYVNDLSSKKQDKALINARRARNIRTVLADPKDTAVESAQFRFWVKKMFKLVPDRSAASGNHLICHEGKPVAIREKLFKILTRAHQDCQHGGRDKTSARVREKYSWVPKELISRFVKICPTCLGRRGASHFTPPDSRRNSPHLELTRVHPHPLYTGYRRKSTYSLSDSSHPPMNFSPTNHDYHHNVGWPDSSSSQFHMDGSGRSTSSIKPPSLQSDAPSQLVEASHNTSLSQYGGSGFLAPHANTRYHGY
ncbi:hypothetical protein BGW36DRAFT_371033 [Talaromyces proteolyticus]|uniref:Integrase zinc-binding domain-containing protein n=1 Tax=Talaromyces proteolyticus TaxID=1131652 RepID=A0AAD4Q5J4_9EURO|nr:uncharacterized protein BGW36DRAFT_371033 [Talaromyces proteolyticus]KAH8704284.1 hypothetical protein BGW36DRAFT_371033 [Talaromyces proteolyticus]